MAKKTSKTKAARRPRVSDQMRQIVNDCGLTRYRLSKLTGIAESTLSKFMSGDAGLSMKAMDKLGTVLDLEIIFHGPQS